MGFHAESLGFADVEEMVADMIALEDGQLGAMARFAVDKTLHRAWRDHHHWQSGSTRVQRRQLCQESGPRELWWDTPILIANGLPDLRLRTAQLRLLYGGFEPGPVDGKMGKPDRTALRRFQAQEGLAVRGELDDATEARLSVTTPD